MYSSSNTPINTSPVQCTVSASTVMRRLGFARLARWKTGMRQPLLGHQPEGQAAMARCKPIREADPTCAADIIAPPPWSNAFPYLPCSKHNTTGQDTPPATRHHTGSKTILL